MRGKPLKLLAAACMAFSSAAVLTSLYGLSGGIDPGVSALYNRLGPNIAPNMITVILFDWRGFDTLGEALVLVSGVLVTALVFGRGQLHTLEDGEAEQGVDDVAPTPILDYFTPLVILLVMALGVYLTLGGHITPGGGFQGGSLVAAGLLIALAVYGRRLLIAYTHSFLMKMESLGVLIYVGLGLIGLLFAGSFLYNVGYDGYDLVDTGSQELLEYPDATKAGIIPYLNVAILLKVSAGLSTVFLVLLGVKK